MVISRRAFGVSIAVFAGVLSWAVGLTSYVMFRDEALAGLAHRHRDVAAAYEDRISELKAEIERTRTRRLVEYEQLERKIEGLLKRQAAIETRQQTLSTLTDRPAKAQTRAETARPKPEAGLAAPRSGRELVALHQLLDRAELSQTAILDRIEAQTEARSRRLRAALDDLGLGTTRVPSAAPMGGPFVPAAPETNFEARAARVAAAVDDMRRLEKAIATMPLGRPIGPEAEVTSGFGIRLDPFLRRPAQHGGIDFRADTGTPVRATAAGQVKEAGWQGGYGNMVEIDHGNGLSTVFGHLSAIEVVEGQTVRSGQIVGRVGSTGRSTGPHLHYETRIAGEAVDPQRFLRAGVRLGLSEID
ncbi:membrane protein [Blastochloris tepida]|uniref:Membrane protein n=2 Tax=Blastochloris tepida TaxID=2233851 RepID=A0A348FZM7_9HYPH|nr:M23 family metallopeptidase [Blastochloris tepida]BBF92760.1 membrane protein [Blastochloris tepida]